MTIAQIARAECCNCRHGKCLYAGTCGVLHGHRCGVSVTYEKKHADYFLTAVLDAHHGEPGFPALATEYQERQHG